MPQTPCAMHSTAPRHRWHSHPEAPPIQIAPIDPQIVAVFLKHRLLADDPMRKDRARPSLKRAHATGSSGVLTASVRGRVQIDRDLCCFPSIARTFQTM